MKRKFQIFISSTYEDLKMERRKVQDAILQMHHFPIGMEMFSAADEDQWEIIKRTIDESDYYILIICHRYGSTFKSGKDKGMSYTEKEYRYASEKRIPIIGFIIDREATMEACFREEDVEKRYRLENFKESLKASGKFIRYWKNADELAWQASIALSNEIEKNKRPGWIRNSQTQSRDIGNRVTEFAIKQISLEDLFKQAKKSISLYGNTLIALNNFGHALKTILDKGINVNLLTMDILDKNYERNCIFFGSDVERMKNNSRSAFFRMKELGLC